MERSAEEVRELVRIAYLAGINDKEEGSARWCTQGSGERADELIAEHDNHESDIKACEDCGTELSELAEHDDEMLCASCIRKDNIRQMEEMDDISNLMGG